MGRGEVGTPTLAPVKVISDAAMNIGEQVSAVLDQVEGLDHDPGLGQPPRTAEQNAAKSGSVTIATQRGQHRACVTTLRPCVATSAAAL